MAEGEYDGPRGLHGFGHVENLYGAISVQDSSAACCEQEDGSVTGPWVWIYTSGGQAGLNEGHAHLNVQEARVIRDALNEFITKAEEECEWIEKEERNASEN